MDAYSPFHIDVRSHNGSVVIAVVGELDVAGARQMQPCIDAALEASAGSLVLDLGDTTFIDSSGISALLAARQKAVRAGGQLHLTRVRPQARRVFELSGVDHALTEVDLTP